MNRFSELKADSRLEKKARHGKPPRLGVADDPVWGVCSEGSWQDVSMNMSDLSKGNIGKLLKSDPSSKIINGES